jgi:hypothetical protein
MRLVILILLCCCYTSVAAQVIVSGIVKDGETGKPIAGASVFISNSSIGTIATVDGNYQLHIPPGKYDIVFSAVGYQTRLISSLLNDSLSIVKLFPKVNELESVTVRTYDKNGWQNWGRFFLENFIGTTQFSDDCKLLNHSVLRFYHDRSTGIISVIAKDVLVIENKSLGYNIRYQLEELTYNTKTRILQFIGYPYFEEMEGNDRKKRRWQSNRKEAYEGSLMHFMRAFFRNKIIEEGFEVHRLKKVRNAEKDRVRQVIRTGKMLDSSNYYNNILAQPDEYDIMSAAIINGDSVGFAVDSFTAGMAFDNYLDITYTLRKAHSKYRLLYPKAPKEMTSQLTITNAAEILIQYNGAYTPANGLLSLGYWSWSEKVATMLPFDYKPPRR